MGLSRHWRGARLLLAAPLVFAQSVTTTSSALTSMMSSSTTLHLAAMFQGQSFLSGFNFFTADDPTGGYVNYIDQGTAQSSGLVSIDGTGAFIMRADSENVASGRGRNSVRIVSNDYYNDGVYILDLNHMPVGCGVWPAFWTVVENGWPVGGEIDIIEAANLPPDVGSTAWTATTSAINSTLLANSTLGKVPSLAHDTVSLHTYDTCSLDNTTFQTGTYGAQTCSAYVDSNQGCNVIMAGNETFGQDTLGSGFNKGNGGWYAMWRDIQNSGGVYVYYWPRDSPNVPDDVRDPSTTSTNVTNWGEPAANLTIPCKAFFGDHVIVFNIAFCGDYSAATYATAGCPGTCTSFVAQNPGAFAETYWSINSLRIYNANGKPIIPPSGNSGLSLGAIIGIAVGGGAALLILALAYWRWRVVKRRKEEAAQANAALEAMLQGDASEDRLKSFSALASGNPFGAYVLGPDGELLPSDVVSPSPRGSEVPASSKLALLAAATKNRAGKTQLLGHKTALHSLDGETGQGFYHQQMEDAAMAEVGTGVALNAFTTVNLSDRRKSSATAVASSQSRKTSATTEPARSRQPSLAPSGMSLAAQRSRMKSVPNVGSTGYVSGSAISSYNSNHVTAGGSFVNAAQGRRASAFQPPAGAQKSWVG